MLAILFAALLQVFAASLWAGDAGKVYFQRLAAPNLDPYTNSPSAAQQAWFRTHFARMGVFSPYFDTKTSWYPNGLVYIDLYGIPKESRLLRDHADWVLRDPFGNRLYIPWGCSHGTCPQYAGDIANPAFRAWWIHHAGAILAHGYSGLWVDDVNMEFRVSDGDSHQVAPVDSRTGRLMTWDGWRDYVAEFVEQIREAFPKAEIMHNSIWFAGPPQVRDRDPAIQRQIGAADNLNIERGLANDPNLTGGTDVWSLHALFAYVDRVHERGRGVTLEEYKLDRSNRQYALAGYFLISSGNDRFGDVDTNPANWWAGYEVNLGTPLGLRTYDRGIYRRKFSCGMVLLGEPGLPRQTINLGAAFTTLEDRRVESVDLSGREGIVLRACQSGPAHP